VTNQNLPITEVNLRWNGPYSWPRVNGTGSVLGFDKAPERNDGGVYLIAAPINGGGYVALWTGHAKMFRARISQHKASYLRGDYTILDIRRLQAGERQEIWHGWAEARRPERKLEFARRKEELTAAALQQLRGMHIFVAKVDDRRLRERTEAATMYALYSAAKFSDIPDKGMRLAPRLPYEAPVLVKNSCGQMIHSMPLELEV
jgi:hypothetical protein